MFDIAERLHPRTRPCFAAAALWIAMSWVAASVAQAGAAPVHLDHRIRPGGTGLWVTPDSALCPPTAVLREVGPPRAGILQTWPGGLFYVPDTAFWTLGRDQMTIAVTGCPDTSTIHVRVLDSVWSELIASFDESPTPLGTAVILAPDGLAADTATSGRLGAFDGSLKQTEIPDDNADDGQANGGSLVAKVDVDDSGDPLVGHRELEKSGSTTMLWRGLAASDALAAQLALSGSTLSFDMWADSGSLVTCTEPLGEGLRDIEVSWWNGFLGAGGGRLRVDGRVVCELDGLSNGHLVVVGHEVGSTTPAAGFRAATTTGHAISDIVIRGTLASPRLQQVEKVDLSAGAVRVGARTIHGEPWAVVDAGIFPVRAVSMPSGPWTVDLGIDTASITGFGNGLVWQALGSGPQEWLVAVQLRQTVGGASVRLLGKPTNPLAATVVSPWVPVDPGARHLAVQWRPGSAAADNGSAARLWVDGDEVTALGGLTTIEMSRIRYGLSGSLGQVVLAPMVLWAEVL